jgi:dTMP kinase
MPGHLIAFEGLDQSGKQTQAERLRDRLTAIGHNVRLVSFPDYSTHIGGELAGALAGEREYSADVMQLLYVANRYEWKAALQQLLDDDWFVVCDRYLASSVAYGEAFGLDAGWLMDIQRYLPRPSMTILLDIAPQTAVSRKSIDRDRYERDLSLQARVRDSYHRLAARDGWLLLDGERARDAVAADVFTNLASRLALQ